MKPRYKTAFIVLALAIAGGCVFLFNSFYRDAKNVAIAKLNQQQLIHAREVALGIEDFFGTWIRSLNSLSQLDVIIADNAVGKRYQQLYYEAHREQIMAITRLDERGVIVDSFPVRDEVGTDLSQQKQYASCCGIIGRSSAMYLKLSKESTRSPFTSRSLGTVNSRDRSEY